MSGNTERLNTALAGRYRIKRQLGQGGMATVYLAQDIKHDRKVAVKVLKPELAAVLGAERFVVEIKTTASLQHPHILPLFDSGTADGFLYYVMPYVEGETLRDKLSRETQLSVEEAVRITIEVADALDYAHHHGVIHRDIKPENILLHDGRPMVADFGIALAVSAAAGGRMTETGLSLGTPHYMSPEQATAEKEITARSDVYSLASVLYEMLAGVPPHEGGSAQQVIMRIIADTARPVHELRRNVPANVDAALAKALEKLPADRFESAKAFANALADPHFHLPGAAESSGTPGGGRTRSRVVFEALAWLVAGAAITLTATRPWRQSATHDGGQRQRLTYSGRAGQPAVSADGRFVAYVESRCPEPPARGGCASLQVLDIGSPRPVEIISGAERLGIPRWTHDGLTVVVPGVMAEGRAGLFAVPRLGGTPRRIADEPVAFDTHPTADSIAIVSMSKTGATLTVADLASAHTAGAPIALGAAPADIAWSPDGRMFAWSSNARIIVMKRDGTPLDSVGITAARGIVRWSANGRSLLSFQGQAGADDDLVAVPVAPGGRLGVARVVSSTVPTRTIGQFDLARRTGRVVVGSGTIFYDEWSFDIESGGVRSHRLTQGSDWYGPPILTADGRAMYYLRADALGNGLYRFADGRETALTGDREFVNGALHLTPDERTITFESYTDSTPVLVVYDVASAASRRAPRSAPAGMMRPDGTLVWLHAGDRTLSISDAKGGGLRKVAGPLAAELASGGVVAWIGDWSWRLEPSGASIAAIAYTNDASDLIRVSLSTGSERRLARFGPKDGAPSVAAWAPDGMIYVALTRQQAGATDLLRVDASTGAMRPYATLPAVCQPGSVSVAAAARRAACVVTDGRADLLLIEGVRP